MTVEEVDKGLPVGLVVAGKSKADFSHRHRQQGNGAGRLGLKGDFQAAAIAAIVFQDKGGSLDAVVAALQGAPHVAEKFGLIDAHFLFDDNGLNHSAARHRRPDGQGVAFGERLAVAA